jgi:hypothetical protein
VPSTCNGKYIFIRKQTSCKEVLKKYLRSKARGKELLGKRSMSLFKLCKYFREFQIEDCVLRSGLNFANFKVPSLLNTRHSYQTLFISTRWHFKFAKFRLLWKSSFVYLTPPSGLFIHTNALSRQTKIF